MRTLSSSVVTGCYKPAVLVHIFCVRLNCLCNHLRYSMRWPSCGSQARRYMYVMEVSENVSTVTMKFVTLTISVTSTIMTSTDFSKISSPPPAAAGPRCPSWRMWHLLPQLGAPARPGPSPRPSTMLTPDWLPNHVVVHVCISTSYRSPMLFAW